MSILVTGGAGYIGSHTVRLLRQKGVDVVVLDTLELGHRSAVGDAALVVGDIANQRLVSETVAAHDVTAVVHFAAYKAVGESMTDPGRYFVNNVGGTAKLLEAVAAAGVKQFVFSSSCSVYGTPERLPVDEDQPIRPESVYAETKAIVERMLGWFSSTAGLHSVSLRYFNAAGAAPDGVIGEDWTASQNLVPLAMKALLGRRPPLQIFGNDYPTPDGTAIRDYIHVDDLAAAHLAALDYLAAGGETTAINVGTGTGSSVLDVLTAAEKAAGRAVPTEQAPRRAGDPSVLYSDTRRSRELLGWSPRYQLDEIVATAWNWHAAHPDGYPEGGPS